MANLVLKNQQFRGGNEMTAMSKTPTAIRGTNKRAEDRPAYRVVENELRFLHASLGQPAALKWKIAPRSSRSHKDSQKK